MVGAQAHEVVVEEDVEHPMQAVFDAPVRRAPAGRHRWPWSTGSGAALEGCLDHGDGLEADKPRLAGEAAVGGEPNRIMADPMAPGFDAAVVGIEDFERLGGGLVEGCSEQRDLARHAWLVVFQCRQVVGDAVQHGLGDLGLPAHGVDRDRCTGHLHAFEQ